MFGLIGFVVTVCCKMLGFYEKCGIFIFFLGIFIIGIMKVIIWEKLFLVWFIDIFKFVLDFI